MDKKAVHTQQAEPQILAVVGAEPTTLHRITVAQVVQA